MSVASPLEPQRDCRVVGTGGANGSADAWGKADEARPRAGADGNRQQEAELACTRHDKAVGQR